MKYQAKQISGNCYKITLLAENADEQTQLQNPASKSLSGCYREAVKSHFGAGITLVSLTLNNDTPYIAVVELVAISGSI